MVSQDFIRAGRAVFTVSNGNGVHYTYKVTYKKPSGKFRETWFVSLLTGPNKEEDFSYMGMLGDDLQVRLTRNSRFTEDIVPFRVINWFLKLVRDGKPLPEGYSAHHEGRCGRCGRTLTVPETIESGIGPECAKKMGLAA